MSQLKIYEGEVNAGLLNDIVAFVLETAGAGHPQRQLVRGRCLFYDNGSSGDSLQDKYGFLYLGELLERYEARFGMALCDLRAIALALGYTMELLTDEMFVGSQRGDFLRKVRQQSQGDIYLTAARYLLADEKGRRPLGADAAGDAVRKDRRAAFRHERPAGLCPGRTGPAPPAERLAGSRAHPARYWQYAPV